MNHGYYVNLGCPSEYHYGLLYTEARVLSLIAIGKGDVPRGALVPADAHAAAPRRRWQTPAAAAARATKQVRGVEFARRLVRARRRPLRAVLGRQHVRGADADAGGRRAAATRRRASAATAWSTPTLQRRYALEELGYPVWGMSPSATVRGRRLRRVRRPPISACWATRRAWSRRTPPRSRWR